MNLYRICICIVCLFEIHAEIEDYRQPEIVIEYVMQMDELDVKTSSRDQSQNQVSCAFEFIWQIFAELNCLADPVVN